MTIEPAGHLVSHLIADELPPKYQWRPTWPDPQDASSHENDLSGWDGDVRIGRIRLGPRGLKKTDWRWCGQGPIYAFRNLRLAPHQGSETTAIEAARRVEEYYERLMAHNGWQTRQTKVGGIAAPVAY